MPRKSGLWFRLSFELVKIEARLRSNGLMVLKGDS